MEVNKVQSKPLPFLSKELPAGRHLLDEEFGSSRMGFLTDRRPLGYRRPIIPDTERDAARLWLDSIPDLLGPCLLAEDLEYEALMVMYIWRDLFRIDMVDLPKTDLVEHRIPTDLYHILKAAKLPLYILEET